MFFFVTCDSKLNILEFWNIGLIKQATAQGGLLITLGCVTFHQQNVESIK